MGNQVARSIQEEGKNDGKIVVINSDVTKYGAMATVNSPGKSRRQQKAHQHTSIQEPDLPTPVQVEENGHDDQNKLILSNGKSPYKIIGNASQVPLNTIICRLLSGIAVGVLLCVFVGLLIDALVRPSDYSREKPVQGSMVIKLDDVDPLWYKGASVSKDKSALFDAQVGWLSCNDVIYTEETFSEYHYGRKANKDIYQQLIYLQPYAYLVEGSWMQLKINITSPPNQKGKNVSLLRFSSYKEYNKLMNQHNADQAHYDDSMQLNYTSSRSINNIIMNFTSTVFSFFGMVTPNGTNFTYNFTVHQVSYNDSNIDYPCYLGADETSCPLKLGSISSTKQCLMSRCIANNEDPAPFYYLDVSTNRRYFNWITCSLIAMVVSLCVLFIAIGTYDVMRRKVRPLAERVVSRIISRNQRGPN